MLLVWMAHNESVERRGNIQTLIYVTHEIGCLSISVVISEYDMFYYSINRPYQPYLFDSQLKLLLLFLFPYPIVFEFNGLQINWPCFEDDLNVPCTATKSVSGRSEWYIFLTKAKKHHIHSIAKRQRRLHWPSIFRQKHHCLHLLLKRQFSCQSSHLVQMHNELQAHT